MELTIIIPTYNRNAVLTECLQAVEHCDAEILVVDDGSNLPVPAQPNVRVLRHEKNRGRAAAVNTGLRAAAYDLALILDDDVYAAPDMVNRLVDEYKLWNNAKLAIAGRITWDPEMPLSLTMRWLEESGPFQGIASARSGTLSSLSSRSTVLWRPFIMEHGGFDETFAFRGMEDVELGLRLKPHGLETRLLAAALGYRHRAMKIRDLVAYALREGMAAVPVRAKFPEFLAAAGEPGALLKNRGHQKEASAAVDEIAVLERGNGNRVSPATAELFSRVYRHYFLDGVFEGIETIEAAESSDVLMPRRRAAATRGLYDQASHLALTGEWSEARRMFRLVRERPDPDYWAGAEYQLGVIESRLGNPAVARQHFMDCVRLNPDHEHARESLSCAGGV